MKWLPLVIGGILLFCSLSTATLQEKNEDTLEDKNYLISGTLPESAFLTDGPVEEWNHTYGTENYDAFFGVMEINDGGFVGFGAINARGYYSGGDFYLVKITANGAVEWYHSYGGSGTDFGQGLTQTNDGGYALLGYTDSYGSGSCDIWLVKTDANGVEQWNRTYGGSSMEQSGKSIVQSSDDGFLLCGGTYSFGSGGNTDGWLVKVDVAGNEEWNRTYGTGNDEHFWDVEITSDGGYILVGLLHNKSARIDYAWVVKTDSTGTIQWENKFGPANQGLDILQTSDGGYVVIAEAQNTVFGGYLNAWMIKLDSFGNEQWSKLFTTPKGKNNFAVHHHIVQMSDGGYILTGVTNGVKPVLSVGDLWFVRTDDRGNILWEKIIGGAPYDTTYWVEASSDGGYILAGATKSYGEFGDFDAWLVKLSDFENQIPTKPNTPEGPTRGKPGTKYTFTSSALEPEDNQLYYLWDWGDGNYSEWLGPYNQGEECNAVYNWSTKGSYNIKVLTKDEYGGESEWSDPLPVTMPKTYENQLWQLFEKIIAWLQQLLNSSIF